MKSLSHGEFLRPHELRGVAYVMHAADLEHQTAIAACKRCRPVVDPIGFAAVVSSGGMSLLEPFQDMECKVTKFALTLVLFL